MKININDLKNFGKNNGFNELEYGVSFNTNNLNVYAVSTYKREIKLLVLLEFEKPYFIWINKKDKAIDIIDDTIPTNWITVKKFRYYDPIESGTLKLDTLTCPTWMVEDESFIYDTYMNKEDAYIKLRMELNEKTKNN